LDAYSVTLNWTDPAGSEHEQVFTIPEPKINGELMRRLNTVVRSPSYGQGCFIAIRNNGEWVDPPGQA
jgi:hypothetical protein